MVRAGPDDRAFYVFGGILQDSGNDVRCNEMWRFDLTEEIWQLESAGAVFMQSSVLTNTSQNKSAPLGTISQVSSIAKREIVAINNNAEA